MENLKESVIHSLKWVAISKIVIQIFRWIATFWVIRLLVPEDYAVVAIAEMIAGYLVAFSSLGLGAPLVSLKTVTERLKRQMLFVGMIVNGLLFTIQFSIAPIIADIYDNEAISNVLRITAFTYIFAAINFIPSSMLTRQLKFKFLSLAEMISGGISSVLTVILAIYDYGYWALIIGLMSNHLIRTVIIISSNEMIFKPAFPTKRNLAVFYYSLKISLSELLFHAKDSIDIVLVGLFLNNRVLGLYNVGIQIASMPLRKIAPPLRKVALPALSKLNDKPEKFESYLLKLQRISFFITIPIFWGISSVSEILVPYVLGEQWNDATPIIIALCLAMPFRFGEEMLHPILTSLKKGNAMMICNFLGLAIFTTSIYLGVQYGINGLMGAWIIGLPLIYLASTIIVCKEVIGARVFKTLSQSFHPMLSGFIMLATVDVVKTYASLNNWPLVEILICALCGGIAYIATTYLTKRSLLNEIKNLRNK